MEPLKNMYTKQFIKTFGEFIETKYKGFDKLDFVSDILNQSWESKELKERYTLIAHVLWKHLLTNKNYSEAIDILIDISEEIKEQDRSDLVGFEYMFLPTCIEYYGLNNFEDSIRGLAEITKLISAEFAVRPFYEKYPKKMLTQTLLWSKDNNTDVKRLASEGCRPALPWGIALKEFKKNPISLLPILDNLKNDASLYVRKSVANNLNDISKTHPELVIKTVKKWIGNTENTDWVVKHACRTLLKAGNSAIMPIFGYAPPQNFLINNFCMEPNVKKGEAITFDFHIFNDSDNIEKLRLEYVIYFMRKNGQHNKKVFMISDKEIGGNTGIDVCKSYSFRPISTRVYYPGIHKLGIKINGEEVLVQEFELIE